MDSSVAGNPAPVAPVPSREPSSSGEWLSPAWRDALVLGAVLVGVFLIMRWWGGRTATVAATEGGVPASLSREQLWATREVADAYGPTVPTGVAGDQWTFRGGGWRW